MIKLKPINVLLYSTSVIIILAAFTVVYLLFAPVLVLENWKVKVDSSTQYTPGSTIYMYSTYSKVKDVSGSTKRYLQCHKPNSPEWDGYIPLTESDANRPTTNNGNSVTALAIPIDVPDIPNTCRIYINVVYNINPFRIFEQHNYSNTFRVISGAVQVNKSPPATPNEEPQESSAPVLQNPSTANQLPKTADTPNIINNTQADAVPEDAPLTSEKSTGVVHAARTTVDNVLNFAGL